MHSRWCLISENGDIFPSLLSHRDQSRYTCDYTLKIANWAHLRQVDCRKLERNGRPKSHSGSFGKRYLPHPLFLPLLPNLLENDIYVTIHTVKSHEEQKTAEEKFSTNYRQGRFAAKILASR